jgi:hypothetical protein
MKRACLSMTALIPSPVSLAALFRHTRTGLFANAINHAFWCQLQDSTHQSFHDKGSLINDPTLTSGPTPASRAQSQTIRACTLSFFDRYLKNQDDHLLDNPAAAYPNIINFQSK